jgi:hypothetical protein
MSWLINEIRKCFCKHDFDKYDCYPYKHYRHCGQSIATRKITYICNKCGYKKSYWVG